MEPKSQRLIILFFFLTLLGLSTFLVLKSLEDNIVYFVCLNNKAILIDAGESKPILEYIDKNNIQLSLNVTFVLNMFSGFFSSK